MKVSGSGVWTNPRQRGDKPGRRAGRSLLLATLLGATFALNAIGLSSVQAQIATGAFSDADASFLKQLASPAMRVQQPTTAGAGDRSRRRELLLIEPRVKEKNAGDVNEADVYIYDYETDDVIHMIVDMNDRRVTKRERIKNLQLPLVEGERRQALDIAFGNEQNKQAIGQAFFDITGRSLDSIRQIKYKAFVFLASSVSEQKARDVSSCGLHRCAKLLLYTADNIALDLSPIIDLSSERVLQIVDPQRDGG